MTIIFKEKMQIPANVVDELITGVGSDIRQVLNMLSTWKLHNDTMGFDEGKMLYARFIYLSFGLTHHTWQREGQRKVHRIDSIQRYSENLGPLYVLCDVA